MTKIISLRQVTELFEAGGGLSTHQQRQLSDTQNSLTEARSQLEAERLRSQRMVSAVRKELGMALVAEVIETKFFFFRKIGQKYL